MSHALAALISLCALLPAARVQESTATARAALVPAGAIALPSVEGRIDHLAVDLARAHLFVAARGNNSVEVLDLATAKVLRSLPASEPQGILYLADGDSMVVANGGAGTCDVYAGDTLERKASVPVGDDADNLRYDPRTKRVYVAYGAGALGILDAATWKVTGSIPLAGHPESFQLDDQGARACVNVPDARHVALVDLAARKVLATWPIEEASANYPMAWATGAGTPPGGLLLLGCRTPAKLLVRSAASGAAISSLALSGDTDDVFYDAQRRRAYAACGEGFVDVFENAERAGFQAHSRIATAPGARTALFVPERNQLFVAVPHRGDQRAEVRLFTVQD